MNAVLAVHCNYCCWKFLSKRHLCCNTKLALYEYFIHVCCLGTSVYTHSVYVLFPNATQVLSKCTCIYCSPMEIKRVELERQTTASNPNGTFGFSVLGGARTKFPAVVCEVDAGGPADRCGKVSYGERGREGRWEGKTMYVQVYMYVYL